jgi:2'-5' RNA ligase
MPRLFVALELPEHAKRELTKTQQQLRKAHEQRVKWVETQNLHLTLLFLGEVADALVPDIKAALQGAGWNSDDGGGEPMVSLPCLSLAQVGAYRSTKQPQTIWVGVGGDLEVLEQLYQAVLASLAPLGFTSDYHRFHPHLTLGRVRRELDKPTIAAIGKTIESVAPPAQVAWQSGGPVLFESILRPTGPIYRKIAY